jgi:hypothetical protein
LLVVGIVLEIHGAGQHQGQPVHKGHAGQSVAVVITEVHVALYVTAEIIKRGQTDNNTEISGQKGLYW